jgi:TolB-like protein/Tfp pilus assembly protein PilF
MPAGPEPEGTLARLRRRKVVQWGLAYAAGAWVLLQVLALVVESYEWPHAVMRIAFGLAVLGFLAAVVLAWYHGDRGEQRVTRPELGILAVLALLGGGLLWRLEHTAETTPAVTPQATTGTRAILPANDASIAVLPFVNMSADREQEYFADGMSEEVLNLLAQLPQLRVIARTSSFSFKGKGADIATIARALNVAHVLEGSVRKSGDTVRITAQLIRASDSSHLWSQTYDRKLTDVFQVQDEIASAVVAVLKVKLLPTQQVMNTHRTANPEAYDQYLLGKLYFGRATPDDFRLAVKAYERAISLDPGYAAAVAGLAAAVSFASDYVETGASQEAGRKRAFELADKAIALAPDFADAYTQRGFLRNALIWDWKGAREDFEKALALEPGSSEVHIGLGELLVSQGQHEEAAAEFRRAIELDPLSGSAWFDLSWSLLAGSHWPEARAALNRTLEINPQHSFANFSLGCLELLQGRAKDALVPFARAGSYWSLAGSAMAEHTLGNARESQRRLDEMVAKYAPVAAYQIAEVHAWRGDVDEAFEWLERAYVQRDAGLGLSIKGDPLLARLRGDPRFAAMLEKLRLPP